MERDESKASSRGEVQAAGSGYHAPADEQRYHGSVGDGAQISGRRRAESQGNAGAEGTVYGAKAEGLENGRRYELRVNVHAVEVNGRQAVADRRAVCDAGDAEVEWRRSRQDSGRETSRQWLDYGRTMRSIGPILRGFAAIIIRLSVCEIFFSSSSIARRSSLCLVCQAEIIVDAWGQRLQSKTTNDR